MGNSACDTLGYFGLFSVWNLLTKWIVFRGEWPGCRLNFESMQCNNLCVCDTLHFMQHWSLSLFWTYMKNMEIFTWKKGDLVGHDCHLYIPEWSPFEREETNLIWFQRTISAWCWPSLISHFLPAPLKRGQPLPILLLPLVTQSRATEPPMKQRKVLSMERNPQLSARKKSI